MSHPEGIKRGRLSRAERQAAIDRVYVAMCERGETRLKKLAEIAGVTPRRIHPYIGAARKLMAEETDELPAAQRTKLANRFDTLFREAIESYESCKTKNDRKNAAEFLKTAVAVVGQHARVLGIEDMPATNANRPNVRIVFESLTEPPAAAKVAAARLLQAASGPAALPPGEPEVQGAGLRSEVGQRLLHEHGDASDRDVPRSGALEQRTHPEGLVLARGADVRAADAGVAAAEDDDSRGACRSDKRDTP